jgi:hypothetical protein
MNKKKIFSILLAAAITFNGATSVFANDMTKAKNTAAPILVPVTPTNDTATINVDDEKNVKISREKAKEIATATIKTYFNIEIDESKFTQRINLNTSNYNGKQNSSWGINWEMYNMEKSINIGVTLNAETGEVIQANNYDRKNNEENAVPTITVKEAEKISDDFIKRIEPKKYNESIKKNYNNLGYYGSTNYNFSYVNKVNGIEFEGNSMGIEIDGGKGTVVSYYKSWNEDLKFPEVKEKVDTKTAVEIFKKEAKMNLKYGAFTQNYSYYENEKDVKLIYSTEFINGYLLDANDGKMLNLNNPSNGALIKDLNEKEKEEFYNKSKVVTPRTNAVEEVEAKKIINSFINELYGAGYVIKDLGYEEYAQSHGSSGNKMWNAYFSKGESERYNESGNISINALTGEILNCSKYSNEDYKANEKFEAKLTWEQAYAKAIDVVAKYYPDKVKKIKTEQYHYNNSVYDKMNETNYYFNFARLENGIEYNENNINVGISAVTSQLNNLNYNWEKDIKFPEVKNIISKEDASEILFNKYKPVLIYSQINKSSNPEKPELEMKLAYKLSDSNGMYDYTNIDALTGKFINYNGENIDQNVGLFKEQIKDSKAEKELSILASRGLIETIDFKLDKKVTQIDLIKMLVNARGYRPYMIEKTADLKFSNITKADANYKYLQMAISYGIMENSDGEFIGEQLVTREELAKTLVKFTNYSKLAQHSEVFKINYKDASKISKENLGYIAIAEAFGFIQIESNEVKPTDNSTMEQLAIGVYNALNNVRNTQY